MNIKQVRYFVAVVPERQLVSGRKEQYVTVQAVSKALLSLIWARTEERAVRARKPRRASTLFGKAFYVKAEPVLRSFDELEAFAHRRRSAESPLLRLGCARLRSWIRASMRQHCIVVYKELGHRNLYTA